MGDFYDVFGQSKKEKIMKDTWGHLAPKPYKVYQGFITYCHGTFGDILIIDFEFKGLESSPWLYEQLYAFVNHSIPLDAERAKVYRFEGTYKCFKSERFEFKGNTVEIAI